MAPRPLLLLPLLLLARAAGGLQCNECTAKIRGVCLTSAKTCAARSGQACGSARVSLQGVAVFSHYGCIPWDACERNSSELSLGLQLELSCCNMTLCNAAAPRAPLLPPGLALGALLGLWGPLR
ncbi:lymphocyte antigen 6 complex locus protein G6c [Struthio camelus]|uniref:lymphocyte antigen 6 complex locus protein G6c n=1 Tax=Struthio camelus TaxID=8801 RepID=UPI003604069F